MATTPDLPPLVRFSNDTSQTPDIKTYDPQHVGGKGHGLLRMVLLDLPVPPGFIIPTDWCRAYWEDPKGVLKQVAKRVSTEWNWLVKQVDRPLIVSVRSGAPVSMPGMMDTVLNVGLNKAKARKAEAFLGEDVVRDCQRRFLRMFAETVWGADKDKLDWVQSGQIGTRPAPFLELPASRQEEVLGNLRSHITDYYGSIPTNPVLQVVNCVRAVFDSWNSDRAKIYRSLHNIPEDMGTACVIQAMVFGNASGVSGTGVLFTRNPSDGAHEVFGEFLPHAQGEDVVASGAGSAKPYPLMEKADADHPLTAWDVELGDTLEEYSTQLSFLYDLAMRLEVMSKDMQDIEFTIEDGKLWILQTRAGKRSARAAFKIAWDLYCDGTIPGGEAMARISLEDYARVRRPQLIAESVKGADVVVGASGSVGVGIGRVAKNEAEYLSIKKDGDPFVWVRKETTPDDIKYMSEAQAIVTETGGITSHAAVVARGMDVPCVIGAKPFDNLGSQSWVTVDGDSGKVYLTKGEVAAGKGDAAVEHMMAMARDSMDPHRVKTDQPIDGAHIVGMEYVETGRLVPWIQSLIDAGVSNARIDLRGLEDFCRSDDYPLTFIAGAEAGRFARDYKLAIERLIGADARENTVILPQIEGVAALSTKLKNAGYRVLEEAHTLADVLTSNGGALPSDRLRDFAGSPEAWMVLVASLEAQGVTFADPTDSVSDEEAAVACFGE